METLISKIAPNTFSYWHIGGISPLEYTRRILTDFGFGSLLEYIEKRLGKVAGYFVLICVCVTIFVVPFEFVLNLYVSGRMAWEAGGEESAIGFIKYLSAITIVWLFRLLL